jgi:hypothetical protein
MVFKTIILKKEVLCMIKPNLAIPVNPELGSQAQTACNDMGFDIVTLVDHFLRQFVQREPNSLQVVHSLITIGKPAILGRVEGKVKIADDFNAPISDFFEPANSPKERMEILRSLIGSINDITFVEPAEVETPDAPRNWELMDV